MTMLNKNPFPYQDKLEKSDRGFLFPLPGYQYNADMNNKKKTFFHFQDTKYKNADREIKSFFHCQNTNTTQT
jgi:hypothetical protein